MKYNVITFGSATLDIFLKTKDFLIRPERKFINQKGICFPFASKVETEDLVFATGGGGTNAAATFAQQGFKTAFCGTIGNDWAGREILEDLKRFKIDDRFVFKTKKARTNFSVIFSFGRDRTCFVWRGASELLDPKKIPWSRIKSEWVYLAPLSGRAAEFFKPLVNSAFNQRIKIFANPGHSQIKLGKRQLKSVLKKIDVLLLNQEEASLLTGVPFQKEKAVFKKLDEMVPGLAVMTKGKKGAVASDGRYLWQVKAPTTPVIEKTGAGDAFGAGFLTGLIKKDNVAFALQLGVANSITCIQKRGAKNGLLKKNQAWKKVRVMKKELS